MREQRRLCVLGVGIFLAVGLAAVVQAAPWAPWERLLTLRRVEADPDKTYAVTGDNGPWMILACSFSGCLLYTSPSPRDRTRSRMPSSA